MPFRFPALLLVGALVLSACDANGDEGELAGTWVGEHTYKVDTVYAEANLHVIADYTARYEFQTDQNGELVRTTLRKYRTGSIQYREPRPDVYVDTTRAWDDQQQYRFDGVGTFVDPTLGFDFPRAEELEVFQAGQWTFDVVADRARLPNTFIQNGFGYPAWIVQDWQPGEEAACRRIDRGTASPADFDLCQLEYFEFFLSPGESEFVMRRENDTAYEPTPAFVAPDGGFDRLQRSEQ